MRPLRSFAALATLSLALTALPSLAHAQVEARCPTGWDSLPAPGGGEERVVVACVKPPMQLQAIELPHVLSPTDPETQQAATQLATQLAQGGTMTASPLRTETIGGHACAVSDLAGTAANDQGLMGRTEGVVLFVPVGSSATVVVLAASHDPAHGNARAAARAFVPTMVGLDGAPPAWRASATCPGDTEDMSSENPPSNGMRRVVRCASEQSGLQFEVLESRLPVRTIDDARLIAAQVTASLGRGLRRIGGSVTADPTEPATFGAEHGFVTAVHGQASNPNAPPGSPGSQLQIEGQMAVLPTPTGGHVQIVAISQGGDPGALRARLTTFVTDNLRLDGSGVPPATPAGVDGGATAAAQPPPHHHRDLSNVNPDELWHPGENEDVPAHPAAANAPRPDESATKGWIWLAIGVPAVAALFYLIARRRW